MNAWKTVIAGADITPNPAGKPGKASKQQRLGSVKAAATAVASTVQLPPIVAPPRQTKLSEHDIFVCDEESHFYSQCIDRLLLRAHRDGDTVIEFGSGDGTPVINSLKQTAKSVDGLTIHGYELNPTSAALAQANAASFNLDSTYQVHNSCFFEGARTLACGTLVANPPYIPAPDDDILMPALHGGVDGANLTRDLMSMGFDTAVLLISAYANPVETMEHARRLGYRCTDFMVTPLPFGYYSSEPKVRKWIEQMKEEGKAFYRGNTYLLAGVRLQKQATKSAAGSVPLAPSTPERDPALRLVNNVVPKPGHSAAPRSISEHKMDLDLTDELLSVLTAF